MTHVGTLPNHWNLFGLRESPYFQDTLGRNGARYPLSLFVGRDADVNRLLAGIGGSSSSRHALGGAPGIGKTTLAQLVKATAVGSGYWATNEVLPFYADDTSERVMGGVLGGLYDAILTAQPRAVEHVAMQGAQQFVRAFRLTSGGANVSIFGVGRGGSRATTAVTPPHGLLLDGPRMIRELLDLAQSEGAKGVVLHVNNLENLSERDVTNAGDILRSLRDPVLMQPGLHTLLVGTTEAVTSTTSTHPQLRSVFTLALVDPLPLAAVQALLRARYELLAVRKRPAAPVAPEAVAALYPLFRGDLRGLLKALEEGVGLLVGLVGTKPSASLTAKELRPGLKQRYAELLAGWVTDARFEQLLAWTRKLGSEGTPTQDELKRVWKVSQAAVSVALKDLAGAGCVVSLPRRTGELTQYALSGASRLVFD